MLADISNRVFLSYAKENEDKVDDVYQLLNASGVDVWMDKYDLVGGQNWDSTIKSEIEKSAVFVAFLSSASVSKTGIVQKEFKFALEQQSKRPENSIFVIPVRIDECEIPSLLAEYHCINSTNLLQGARTLLKSINEALEIRNRFARGKVSRNVLQRPLHDYIVEEPGQNIHNKDFVVLAPFSGMFYRGPSPEESPYCRKGDSISKGDAMFILESCKTYIVFRAHRNGIVTTFLAENDSLVKKDDPLIVFRPVMK
ncbi:hypothetical protein BJL95_22400 [Methylomonas sp. LWB]|uniref:TIR domain-containing protein n=1 Tax=Methylomonas sp. LWB TaxID=1905845 RepID=UPI0008D99E06|nr:TIR domain-containing protein [Methylomonas sp. LWB]OHX36006.1 hypothetical protein BJL95_22400 [Methylomonas sp. LWB]